MMIIPAFQLPPWQQWLEASWLAVAVRDSLWAYPLIETVHIIGFCVLVGGAVLFDLRLLGVSRHLSVPALEGHLLRWARISLVLILPTGFLMFMPHATALSANPVFRLKILLIACAGLNALLYRIYGREGHARIVSKVNGCCSLILWFSVLTCGRLLAFL
jgi:Family of unknown function (DUF6644)